VHIKKKRIYLVIGHTYKKKKKKKRNERKGRKGEREKKDSLTEEASDGGKSEFHLH
jgi:hypothetical protein